MKTPEPTSSAATPRLLPSGDITLEELKELRARLDCFYAVGDYLAFQTPSDQVICWEHIRVAIRYLLDSGKDSVHVLEVGAGKTGFARFLTESGLRSRVVFHTQDVTNQNEAWLREQTDFFHFGDVGDCACLPSSMDIVFSTYVFEHVTDPATHLDKLWTLLAPSGRLMIFSPRYDLPGYLCPSTRHLSSLRRADFFGQALRSRVTTLLTGSPQFLIQTDLAAFHLPFYLDADAVHWVSLLDLRAWARQRGAFFRRLRFGRPIRFSKDWIIKRFCTTAVCLTKAIPDQQRSSANPGKASS